MDLSVVILTLMKLPEAKMASLKKDFGRNGLSLEDFIASILRHMPRGGGQDSRIGSSHIETQAERVETASDLTDFFAQVDVDGKGVIRWEDFLTYIIEQSIALKRDIQLQDCYTLREDYDLAASSHREFVHRVLWNPSQNRLYCCVAQKVKIFNLFSKDSPSKSRLSCEIQLTARGSLDYVGAHDILYVEEHDLLLCLQINLCVSFWKFLSRQYISSEYIEPAGDVTLSHQPYKMRWSRATQQVITVGNDKNIMVWALRKTSDSSYTLIHRHTIVGHTDVVQAVIFAEDREGTELLVSAGLDRCILFWDLSTYRCVKTLTGHYGSIHCLAYDGESQVFSAGYDSEIFVWDVKGSITSPTYKLEGPHKSPLQSMSCSPESGRLCTLDRQGKAVLWDIRKSVALDPRDRCIQVLPSADNKDRCSSVEMVSAPGSLSKKFTLNGVSIIMAGNRVHIYDCIDPRPPDGIPSMVVYNPESVTILTVHGCSVKVWDACSGQFMKEFVQLSRTDITSLALDKGRRKIILSNLDGDVNFYNYYNGKMLRHVPHRSGGEVGHLIYTERSQLLITASSDRSLRVVDEMAASDNDCLLRHIQHAHKADICLIAYDEDLCLLASMSEEGLLRIWDFQFMFLDGSCEPAGDTTTLAFMYPWPILLAGDSGGGITLIPVRPWTSPTLPTNTPACRIQCVGGGVAVQLQETEGGGDANEIRYALPAITCLTVATMDVPSTASSGPASTRHVVYVGNARGVVRVYDLSGLLDSLGIGTCAEADLPSRRANFNCRRKLVRRSQGSRQETFNQTASRQDLEPSLQSAPPPPPPPPSAPTHGPVDVTMSPEDAKDATLLYSWVAHDESVLCITVLDHPQALFTSSQDLSVKLWSRSGSLLGVLTWGRQADLSQRRFWNFPFDFTERHRVRAERALKVLDKLSANHAKTVRRFVDGSRTAAAGMTTSMTTTSLPDLTSGLDPSELGTSPPSDSAVVHEAEMRRILGQLHGEATGRGQEHEHNNNNNNHHHQLRDHASSGQPGSSSSVKKLKKRKGGGGAHDNKKKKQGDPILRTIKSVDRVVAKFAQIQQQRPNGRNHSVPKPKMDSLRSSYEERQPDMYPHLFLYQEKVAAQSEFSKAVRRLEHLKDILANGDGKASPTNVKTLRMGGDDLRLQEGPKVLDQVTEQDGRVPATPEGIVTDAAIALTPPLPSATGRSMGSTNSSYTVRTTLKLGTIRDSEPNGEPTATTSRTAGIMTARTAGTMTARTMGDVMTARTITARAPASDEKLPAEDGPLPPPAIIPTNNVEKKPAASSNSHRKSGSGNNDSALVKRLVTATQASARMESPAKQHLKLVRLSSREKQEKRVKVKRRFGPYCRSDFLDLYDSFRTLDSRHTGHVALKDLLATRFCDVNPDFRTQLERHYYGKEGSETRQVTLREALRMIFPLVGKVERRQVLVLIDMYEHHLAQAAPKQQLDQTGSLQKTVALKSLFEMYDRDGSGTVEVSELIDGLQQNKTGQWEGIEKEIEHLSGKKGLLTLEEFVRVFKDML